MDTSYLNQTEKDLSGQPVDRLKLLYPNVDEKLTPLPRSWSSQEKCTSIGLTQNNLRVHYKGFYPFRQAPTLNYQKKIEKNNTNIVPFFPCQFFRICLKIFHLDLAE